jgi:hypothetical protein
MIARVFVSASSDLEFPAQRENSMLKIVNQTTYEIKYDVGLRVPTSQHIAEGVLAPGHIAAYRIDNDPKDRQSALNCHVTTYRVQGDKQVWLESISVPGNATVVFSTQILTGLLQPGS